MTHPTPQHYHIFGQGISQSLSPTIHNAAFAHYGLPHRYDIQECNGLQDVKPLIDDPAFGGSSVTMPHKLSAGEFCAHVADSATRLGAINTLIARSIDAGDGISKREIHGDNTDWSGLYSLIKEYASGEGKQVGLVIGAGGAARAGVYAMAQAGVERIYVGNRTFAKAEQIARDFQDLCRVIPVQFPSALPEAPDVIIGTVPGEAMSQEAFKNLFGNEKGLCIEMAYKPRVTNLLAVARENPGWTTADGVEVLLRQGFEQFRLWTGLDAPEEVMRKAVEVATGSKVGVTSSLASNMESPSSGPPTNHLRREV
ncbi:hypothetical protein BDV34DRAFT_212882 [Aspergillus parasiticus]|uniref:Shikimate dehydrogenase substrate binding N-terminal domain-containing protein n=1 Tax=Aspergillus parasiticus TaxID=5067 RepID=A0A5N6DKX7_ASPPA|nr:hypothetical protein BDV34DRAFT_212882 [Aspergillus parasiticus]